MAFGPQNDDETLIFAIEALKADVQFEILRALKDDGLTRAMLAERLNVSPAWVSQILSDNANPTLASLVKIFSALGRRVDLSVSLLPAHADTLAAE